MTPFRTATALALAVAGMALNAHAGFPLVVDDTAVHTPAEREWVVAIDGARTTAQEALGASVSLVTGFRPDLEGSIRLGYGWTRDRNETGQPVRDGFQDLTLGVKTLLWAPEAAPFSLAAGASAKLPTAKAASGLGTGFADLGVLAIASGAIGALLLDLNGGYTWTAIERRARRPGDSWFAGTALRWKAMEKLTLFVESYAVRPTDRAAESTLTARAGWQFELRPGMVFSGAIGQGRNRSGAETLGTLGLTILH